MRISSYSERYALLNNCYKESKVMIFSQVSQKEKSTVAYQQFSRQLFHACLAYVYSPLKPAMTTPEVVQCPDRHFRRAIFSIGPYIADYPEQVWLTATVQNWCPKYAIYRFHKSLLTYCGVDAMLGLTTWMIPPLICVRMRRLISFANYLILALFGMSMAFNWMLWYVKYYHRPMLK